MASRIIFTMSTGRCGTMYLANMLSFVPGVTALHEPDPNFVRIMRSGQNYIPLFYRFMVEYKLPYIHSIQGTYIETSHLFIQGFAEPTLHLIVPDIIILRRKPREVALSMWRNGAVPGRNHISLAYLLQPDDDVLAPIVNGPHWHKLTDYQLCYWFTAEIERRIQVIAPKFMRRGAQVCRTTMKQITTKEGFLDLLTCLELPPPTEEYYSCRETRLNFSENDQVPDEDLDQAEQELLSYIGSPDDVPASKRTGWWTDLP